MSSFTIAVLFVSLLVSAYVALIYEWRRIRIPEVTRHELLAKGDGLSVAMALLQRRRPLSGALWKTMTRVCGRRGPLS